MFLEKPSEWSEIFPPTVDGTVYKRTFRTGDLAPYWEFHCQQHGGFAPVRDPLDISLLEKAYTTMVERITDEITKNYK